MSCCLVAVQIGRLVFCLLLRSCFVIGVFLVRRRKPVCLLWSSAPSLAPNWPSGLGRRAPKVPCMSTGCRRMAHARAFAAGRCRPSIQHTGPGNYDVINISHTQGGIEHFCMRGGLPEREGRAGGHDLAHRDGCKSSHDYWSDRTGEALPTKPPGRLPQATRMKASGSQPITMIKHAPGAWRRHGPPG